VDWNREDVRRGGLGARAGRICVVAIGRLPVHRHGVVNAGANPCMLQLGANLIPGQSAGPRGAKGVLVVDVAMTGSNTRAEESLGGDVRVVVASVVAPPARGLYPTSRL